MIPEQWTNSFPAKNGRFKRGQGDDEKGGWMPGPHVDDKKGKKAMVYKARKDRRKRGPEKQEKRKTRSLGHVQRDLLLHSMLVSLIFLH